MQNALIVGNKSACQKEKNTTNMKTTFSVMTWRDIRALGQGQLRDYHVTTVKGEIQGTFIQSMTKVTGSDQVKLEKNFFQSVAMAMKFPS